ncbi:universal stress protein [Candidatus Sumerlaeota bacterium]|nr:universal stress protein [Candidatus Sumerlaeota bacterium]
MDRLKNIIVGVDFSSRSRVALSQAVRMAGWNRAKLHVVHVLDPLVLSDLTKMLKISEGQMREEARSSTLERIDEMLASVEVGDLQIRREVLVGNPFDELLRLVNNVRADLLVLGSAGEFAPGQVAGALASKCVRKVPTKVMLVREEHAHPFARVVACIDFSETSRRVVQQAWRVAQQDGAEAHFVHVYAAPWKVVHWMAPTRQASPEYQRQFLSTLMDTLGQFVRDSLRENGADGGFHFDLIEHDECAQGIVEFVRDHGADLTIIGTRGRTGVKSLLMGTTAERVVQRSPSSVLAIKPDNFRYRLE